MKNKPDAPTLDGIRTDGNKGDRTYRLTLSLTARELALYEDAANSVGMKVTQWLPVAVNRILLGLAPLQQFDLLPKEK